MALALHNGGLEGTHHLPRIAKLGQRRTSFERALERSERAHGLLDDHSQLVSHAAPVAPSLTLPQATPRVISDTEGSTVTPHTSITCPPGTRSAPSRPSRSSRGPRRKVLCTWGSSLGQQSLLTVATGLEPIQAPYTITVSYDLRPILAKMSGQETLYLAALDADKLRRRGAGTGLDAMQASESWLARDCICSSSGKLKPLTAIKCPGEVKLTLAPAVAKGENEVFVILRITAIRDLQDSHDWHALGSAVVLKVDAEEKLEAQGPASFRGILENDETPHFREKEDLSDEAGVQSELCGIPLHSLVDFQKDIEADLERYCAAHRVCRQPGRYGSYHICLSDPCPFRPMNKQKFDDHRGIPFTSRSEVEAEDLDPLVPDMQLVASRHVWPYVGDTSGGHPLLTEASRGAKVGTYISHSWREPVAELIQTLQRALSSDEVIFVPGLLLGKGAAIHGRSGGTGEFAQRPLARALQKAEKLLIAADRAGTFADCLWCAFEASKAREWQTQTLLWPHPSADLAGLQEAISRLDLLTASLATAPAAEPAELRRLVMLAIQSAEEDVEACSGRLRAFLQNRLQCFARALQEVGSSKGPGNARLQRLCLEQERRVALREVAAEHARRVEALLGAAEEQRTALESRQELSEAASREVAEEVCRLERRVAQIAEEEAAARLLARGAEDACRQKESQLKEAADSAAFLHAALESERKSHDEDLQLIAELRQAGEARSSLVQELQAEVAQEREQNAREEEMRKAWQMKSMALAEKLQQAEETMSQLRVEAHKQPEQHTECLYPPQENLSTSEPLQRQISVTKQDSSGRRVPLLGEGKPAVEDEVKSIETGSTLAGCERRRSSSGFRGFARHFSSTTLGSEQSGGSGVATGVASSIASGVNYLMGSKKKGKGNDHNSTKAHGSGGWSGGSFFSSSRRSKGQGHEDDKGAQEAPARNAVTDVSEHVVSMDSIGSSSSKSPTASKGFLGIPHPRRSTNTTA